MDTSALIAKLKQSLGNKILDSGSFGKAKGAAAWPTLWVEARALPEVMQALSKDTTAMLDWLESIEIAILDKAMLINYFLRSHATQAQFVVRVSLPIKKSDQPIELPTVSTVFPIAAAREAELGELFGIRFTGLAPRGWQLLPEGWQGYPMRKDYLFPTEFGGVPHMRPVNRTAPDEHGVLE